MRLKTILASVAALALTLTPALGQDRYFSIASAPTGGVFYPIGGGLAALWSEHLDGVSATAEATSGSIDNVKLTGSDPTYLGLSSADVVAQAAAGAGAFEGTPLDLRTLLIMYPNLAQVLVSTASDINSVEDMAGKRVGTGAPGSGFELFSVRLLEAAGIDAETGVERVKLSTQDTINALRDGKIDAMVFVGGTPAGGLTDLLTSANGEFKFLPLGDYIKAMNAAHGNIYSARDIRADAYPGQTRAVGTIGVWNLLVANADLTDADAKAMCDVIFDHLEQFQAVHPALGRLNLETQISANSPIPLHPGAVECLTARGVSVK